MPPSPASLSLAPELPLKVRRRGSQPGFREYGRLDLCRARARPPRGLRAAARVGWQLRCDWSTRAWHDCWRLRAIVRTRPVPPTSTRGGRAGCSNGSSRRSQQRIHRLTLWRTSTVSCAMPGSICGSSTPVAAAGRSSGDPLVLTIWTPFCGRSHDPPRSCSSSRRHGCGSVRGRIAAGCTLTAAGTGFAAGARCRRAALWRSRGAGPRASPGQGRDPWARARSRWGSRP